MLSVAALVSVFACAPWVTPQDAAPGPVDVFVGGAGGYGAYRIPALLTTTSGAVLAFAEGRSTLSDHAQNDIVARRSDDGGATWGALRLVQEAGADTLSNPCVVQLHHGPHPGRILLFYQRYPDGCHERCVVPGLDGSVCRAFVTSSDDDGRTWSEPREITRGVKPADATSLASGPGIALQKRRAPHVGRVVVPFNCGPFGAWRVFAAFSDDGGETWRHGAPADDTRSPGRGNEVQFVELANGALLLNARGQGGRQLRKAARSRDGGVTWTPLVDVEDLVEPQCMGALVRLSERAGQVPGRLVYSGPRSRDAREGGALAVSFDEGRSWPLVHSIYPGSFAYSALAVLPGGDLGCLFERDGYARISFVRVEAGALTLAVEGD